MNDKIMSAILAGCLALSSFSLKFAFDANADIKSMKATSELQFIQIQKTLDSMATDKESDVKQDRQLEKMWKLHSWAKDQINDLKRDGNKPSVPWPDLD